ncbi:MAG: biotin/lipoyl-binding protein [Candidatus Aminicenantes bacterium]|nr:biotin/lipoyl-binding protein [Candidatus Aminicenantes bacterium]MDH5743031.1 biotin/lipoyl-binding protein [Candidatus Aminicenantes bacterium]
MNVSFWIDNKEFRLSLTQMKRNDLQVSLGKKKYHVTVEFLNPDEILLNVNGKIYNVIISSNTTSYFVYVNERCFGIEKKSARQILGQKKDKQRMVNVETSMPGRIVKILLKEGDEVEEGQAVLILEAMKMQNEIKSPQAGKITKIGPKAGDSVETGAVLFAVG